MKERDEDDEVDDDVAAAADDDDDADDDDSSPVSLDTKRKGNETFLPNNGSTTASVRCGSPVARVKQQESKG